MKRPVFFTGLFLLLPLVTSADVRLPGFYGDHMVLQRDNPIPIRGWADPGEEVTVTLGEGEAVKTTAGEDGTWKCTLPATIAGGPYELKVNGNNSLTLTDVLVGEVWLCSGQSNMEWIVANSLNSEEEIAAAEYPQIRHIKIEKQVAGYPNDDVGADWELCSPESVGTFTAAGYFMARQLHKGLGVPIGLLNSSWGGTLIEPWTPVEGFAAIPELASIHNMLVPKQPDSDAYRAILNRHLEAARLWTTEAEAALENRTAAPLPPAFPDQIAPVNKHTQPTAIYNAMMNPLVGYGMRGAIWYQGESNHNDGMAYYFKKQALLSGWRGKWGLGDFPFYFVQIAPFEYGQESPGILPLFWEAQSACLAIPNTGMVVTNDIGNIKNIHPKNKQEVGRRLALLALKHTYGQENLVADSPSYESMANEVGTLRITFGNAGEGLRSRDGKPLSHFEIIGKDAVWRPATAKIENRNEIVLSSKEVPSPEAMRFAWDKTAEPNLENSAGLPASAFRAGDPPVYDFLQSSVPQADEYELVYDLDLTHIGPVINYSADRSSEIEGAIDRIAYCLELVPLGGDPQYLFVAVAPFTQDLTRIGVPTAASKAFFQTTVENMEVISNVQGIGEAKGLTGNIEFWPNNYGPANHANIPGASATIWDFGDEVAPPAQGYGSMQIHIPAKKLTLFAINHWDAGPAGADIGIGNSEGRTLDWTFAANSGRNERARLRILVRVRK